MGRLTTDNFRMDDDQMEEDEILKRELGENTNSLASSSQKKAEVLRVNTTTDSSNITDHSSKKTQPKGSAKKEIKINGAINSSKSAKQLNIADWVSSASKASG